MAQPRISIEQVQHLLTGAEAHARLGSYNKPMQDLQIGVAIVQALLLVAQELDQVADALAVQAGLKQPADAEIT